MTQEERIAQLEQENTELRTKLAEAYQQITQLAERLQRVEEQLANDSHNSSKPPSSDGPRRRPGNQRQRSEKQTGGQLGHTRHTLMQVASPDEVVCQRPPVCCTGYLGHLFIKIGDVCQEIEKGQPCTGLYWLL